MSDRPTRALVEAAPPAARLKPPSLPVDTRSRRWIVFSFWAVVLLGLPLWWSTTTLERRSLPNNRVQDWADNWEGRIPRRDDLRKDSDSRVARFSSHYKVVLSLLNQDASRGGAILTWDAPSLIKQHLRPLLTTLRPLHNFTFETHIQYFSPLAIKLHRDEQAGTLVEENDLRAFVNNADWNLATGDTLDPVIHLMLYVPSAENRPMRIRAGDGIKSAPAFIMPQRGGVVIFNPPPSSPESPSLVSLDLPSSAFAPSFRLLEQQLRILLGLGAARLNGVEQAQVDRLIHRRMREAVEGCVETLQATVKMARDIPNMRIGRDVQERVKQALDALDNASSASAPVDALRHAALAQTLASQAYFDPSMVALLYFPDEHKYAIYTPLFVPVAVPLLVGLLREFKAWKKARKEKMASGKLEGRDGFVDGKDKVD
ncbi:phosphatidylinositol glycan, class S [Rhodotorula toruloides]|uniref:Phosphatidylinositol glycan, class S n=1 Tax=Rhodotorula toruloides TaxID=5286 RepID=A0A511KAS7_RHOTO|nr:phosphatidylinositol glycan, class S [Rhodotorula toruloides]